ncbi:hypothetical protein NIASO_14495 [Niabella soli DSM 19437]|uniref:GH16 domain-containing protein n=2 Tax=Niabella TaxID=379899 RepID=W0F7M2_9BACT|nr:hypothetical protein NIASO_14495 [Niabella soli DSM 19437]
MKRKKFIQQIGKGLALSTLPMAYTNVAASAAVTPKKPEEKVPDGIYRPEGYHLVWEDDFKSNKLDESEWFYRRDIKMNSAQRPENVSVADGRLLLAMKQEDFLGMRYTGAGIVSKRRWQHGYYEVKAKLTNAKGWHHSFWAQEGTGFLTFSSDRSMEIDIFEMESTKASNHNLWIYPDGWSSRQKKWHSVPNKDLGFDAADDYHIYGYEYTTEGIKFFVDGKITHTIEAPEEDHKHYSLNLWLTVIATQTNVETKLPVYDYIEYIRCYAKDPDAPLPPKWEPAYEKGTTIYIDNSDAWGFNMGDYWEIAAEGNFYGHNYYKYKRKETYNPLRDWALFRPFISEAGNYDIYLRWVAGADRCSKVPLEIWYDGGLKNDTTKSINQQEHNGEWVKIGNYPFRQGWNNLIKLIVRNTGYVIADAAKFVKTS